MTEQEYGNITINEIISDIESGSEKKNIRWEAFTNQFIEDIKIAKVYIDCGAEYGFYIRLALKYGTSDLKIIGFEPEPIRYKLLKDSFSKNSNVTIRPEAVADMQSTWSMIKTDVGVSASFEGFIHPQGDRFVVNTLGLDEEYTNVNVIKIDIEGGEDLALVGMKNLLSKCKPTLFIEFHPYSGSWQDMMRQASKDSLIRIGYSITNSDSIIMDHGGRAVLRSV